MADYISISHMDTIKGNYYAYERRNAPEEQIDLRTKLAYFSGVPYGIQLTKIDEAVFRAYNLEKNEKYKEIFRAGNPELREVIALTYYHYGYSKERDNLIRSYLHNLDSSKKGTLAEQFVNQIENNSIKKYCINWMQERQDVAEYLLPIGKIELRAEERSLDITPREREILDKKYSQMVPTLRSRSIREPPKSEFIIEEKERIQKSPIISEEGFGQIKLPVPEEITDAIGRDVRSLFSDKLEEFKKDIENLKEKYHIYENYVEWLNNKEKEINKILEFRDKYNVDVTAEKIIEIPILDSTPIPPKEREVTAEKEELKLKSGKEIKETEKQFIREEQQRVEKSPIIPEEDQIAQEIEELERKIEKNVWTASISKDLSKSDSREFPSFNQRVEYEGTVEMFPGIEVPYKIREIRKGNRIEKYAFFDPNTEPFAEAIKAGEITKEEANLFVLISLAQRDVSILTMEYLDELAISAEYKKQGKIELAKVHEKEAEKILLDLESRNADLEFEREKYSKLTGKEPEVLVVEETKRKNLKIILGPIVPSIVLKESKKEEIYTSQKETPKKIVVSESKTEETKRELESEPVNPWQIKNEDNRQIFETTRILPVQKEDQKSAIQKTELENLTKRKEELLKEFTFASSDERRILSEELKLLDEDIKKLQEAKRVGGNESGVQF
ncbi:hypothetical protein KO317_00300 [Candidatus Micrarchaeota archaeon]|nr:hypothetical protein [Candidatus Micrarchaeota archaeon]